VRDFSFARPKQFFSIALLIVIGFVLIWVSSLYLPDGIDWKLTYRPAALKVLSAQNPYTNQVNPEAPFVAAPWSLIPLLPFAFFQESIGRAMLFLLSIFIFVYSAYKLSGSMFAATIFILSPPVIHCLLNANIEWLPILGFVLPPQIGLFLISSKPQTGFAIAIFWLYMAWRSGGIREVVKVFAPFTIVLLVSFLIFGLWPLSSFSVIGIASGFNASLWPSSLPIGISFLFLSLTLRREEFAMAASPFLSPYVLFHSYSSSVIALIKYPVALLGTNIALWVLVWIRFMQGL
jgi:hypothetical protein